MINVTFKPDDKPNPRCLLDNLLPGAFFILKNATGELYIKLGKTTGDDTSQVLRFGSFSDFYPSEQNQIEDFDSDLEVTPIHDIEIIVKDRL